VAKSSPKANQYMKEWREKNREKQRAYMREWQANRRKDAAKKEQDKKAPGAIFQQQLNVARWKGYVVSLDNTYIKGLLTRRNPLIKNLITPEMIFIHKKQLLTKRKLKDL